MVPHALETAVPFIKQMKGSQVHGFVLPLVALFAQANVWYQQ